jgi:hypothetical protein
MQKSVTKAFLATATFLVAASFAGAAQAPAPKSLGTKAIGQP